MAKEKNNRFLSSIWLPLQWVGLLWVIQGLQWLFSLNLGVYGIYPREIFGLRGVVLAPLLHSGWGHLLSNTPPLFVLSAMILFFYRRVAIPAMIQIYLLTGLLVWTFGRSVFHIGASGVIYGLVAFVFWTGIFRRNIKSIALALIVAFYYGSMFMGIIPGQEGISWESHLLGGIAGIFAAFWYKNISEKDEEKPKYSWELEERQSPRSFFDSDIFDKTKAEREREKQERLNDDDYWFSNRT